MNIKIKLAYFAMTLSAISLIGVFYGSVISVRPAAIVIFAVGCFFYSFTALYFFKKDGNESSSKALIGSFVAMTIFLIIHLFLLVATLTSIEFQNQNSEGIQFVIASLAMIPAMIVGAIIGFIVDFVNLHSGKIAEANTPYSKRIISRTMMTYVIGGSLVIGFILALMPALSGNDTLQNFLDGGWLVTIRYAVPLAGIGMLIGTIINIVNNKKSNS